VLCACDEWRRRQGVGTPAPFWLVRLSVAGEDAETSASCHPLSAWAELRQEQGQVLVAMADPCHLPLVPGWPLRNLLMMASARWAGGGEDLRLRVLCVRDGSSTGRASAADGRSFVVDVCVPPLLQPLPPDASAAASADNETSLTPPTPEALGWEPDATGRPLPRHVDLSSHLSPLSLAEQAVALNLRLMRWRASPALDLAALAQCRCLLLGAGTLGCALARTLLAWGVRRITLVDDGRVSYSNPVRQSLYEHADCLDGGKPKAQAAADALVRVFPGVEARGVALCIPMPGHGEGETIEADALRLDTLVEEHDAVFLLTDTRESRWLPTLLAAARRKVAVTAALGFDGYLVMRHGVADEEEEEEAEGGGGGKEEGEKEEEQEQQKDEQQRQEQQRRRRRVGCYFCQDVVAPSDSTRARALDQQCTVARPGLAPIAGALSAELLAALLQHPLGVDAPAAGDEEGEGEEDATAAPPALGPVPHMIRGQLSGFSQVCMSGRAFPQCTACGPAVVRAWRERGAGLVREAADDPSALERLTGLGELREEAERRLGGLVLSEEEEDGGGKGGADDDEDDDWVDL
jgi:ubiquitin-like modifier-activating enzyme ATG7